MRRLTTDKLGACDAIGQSVSVPDLVGVHILKIYHELRRASIAGSMGKIAISES